MDFLEKVYKERKEYFENLEKYLEEIKKYVKQIVPDAKIYLFGSVLENNYSIGLSDIDIAIVSDKFKNREEKLYVFGILTKKYLNSPFEFHVLTTKQWEFFKKFLKEKYKEI